MLMMLSVCMMVCSTVYMLDYMDWSLYMRSMVGNPIKNRYIDCLYQNVPGYTRVADLQTCIDTILWKYKPMLLGLGEIEADKVEQCVWPGFTLLRGKLNG